MPLSRQQIYKKLEPILTVRPDGRMGETVTKKYLDFVLARMRKPLADLFEKDGGEETDWAQITGRPTTLAGYGITDALGKVNSGVTAATYGSATKVGQFTVNAYGLVTSATEVTLTHPIPLVQSVTSAATVTPTSVDDLVTITAQAVGLTIANPTGTFNNGQAFIVRVKDNNTSQTISYGSKLRAFGSALPTSTTQNKWTYLYAIYNSGDDKFDVVNSVTEF